jgi:hypothetical protein
MAVGVPSHATMIPAARRAGAPILLLALLAVGASACATTTSSNSFKGEQHAAAQTIANLQSAATAGEAGKICKQLLSHSLVSRLDVSAGGCQKAIKKQLEAIDTFEVSVQSVALGKQGPTQTATAGVKSIFAGKSRPSTLTLVKEGGVWRISGLGS